MDARTVSLLKNLHRTLSKLRTIYFRYLASLGLARATLTRSFIVPMDSDITLPKAKLMASEPTSVKRSQARASSSEKPAMTSRVPAGETG